MRIMMMIIIMRIIMMNDVRFAALAAILPKRPNRAKTRRDDREPTSQPASSKAPYLPAPAARLAASVISSRTHPNYPRTFPKPRHGRSQFGV